MTDTLRAALLILVIAATVMTVSSAAISASWAAFDRADFAGVALSPMFASNSLTYDLSLSANPTITISDNTFDILWIQGVYTLSSDSAHQFCVKGKDIVDVNKVAWAWDTNLNNTPSYLVAGWNAQGSNYRLTPGNNISFSYTTLQIPTDMSVILGLHVGYYDSCNNKNKTAFFKTSQLVPEPPTTLLWGFGGTLLTIAPLIKKRLGRRN